MSRHYLAVAIELDPVQWTVKSRHLKAVATSTLNQKQSRHQLARNLRSRHHHLKKEGLDISQMSRHQKSRKEVATSFSCRDTSCIEKKVATTSSCRDINSEDLRSRHHQAVATTGARKRGCDIIKLSRHLLQRPEGRDNIKRSRHQIQRVKVATSVSCRDISSKNRGRDKIKLSGHQFLQRHVATKQRLLRQRLRQQRSRQGLDVATVSTNGPINLKSTMRCIKIRAQLQNPINTQLLLKKRSS